MSREAVETPVAAQRRFRPSVVLPVIVGALLVGLLGWRLQQVGNSGPPQVGERAPDMTLEFFDGYQWDGRQVADLSDMQGQIVVINFWASWCPECHDEAEEFERVYRKYKDNGVVFLGVAHSDLDAKSYEYLADYDITYPNAPDLRLAATDDYGVTGIPETYIIDRDGRVAYLAIRAMSEAELESVLNDLLASS